MASDYHLKIDGIDGESKDAKHTNEIQIQSFSWGNSNAGSSATGTGAGSGKTSFQDVHFTVPVSKASPKLMLACANGDHIKKAVLTVRKQGKDQQEFYVVTLTDIIVSSYQSGGHDGNNSVPTDQFSLNFTTVKFEYKPQKADGTLDAAITAGWDVKANKKL